MKKQRPRSETPPAAGIFALASILRKIKLFLPMRKERSLEAFPLILLEIMENGELFLDSGASRINNTSALRAG